MRRRFKNIYPLPSITIFFPAERNPVPDCLYRRGPRSAWGFASSLPNGHFVPFQLFIGCREWKSKDPPTIRHKGQFDLIPQCHYVICSSHSRAQRNFSPFNARMILADSETPLHPECSFLVRDSHKEATFACHRSELRRTAEKLTLDKLSRRWPPLRSLKVGGDGRCTEQENDRFCFSYEFGR